MLKQIFGKFNAETKTFATWIISFLSPHLFSVSDMDLLLSELNENSLPSMSGQRLRARAASQSAINDAHTAFLISKSSINPPTSSNITRADSTSSNPSFLSAPDPRQKDACRTLYVGNLDKHCKEEILRARFNFGHILELDIKNRDSFSPFAFIQFTDIMAVVNAITANQNNRLDISGLKSDRNGKIKVSTYI
jgi:RNA recognition motif-containing protein